MFWLNSNRMRLVVVGIVAAIMLGGGSAKADFTFGEPMNLGPAVNYWCQDGSASLSTDGLSLFYDSDYPDAGYWNLFVVTRETTSDPWGDRVKLGPNVNKPNLNDWCPSISADGLELYFGRGDRYKGIQVDLYVTTRETINDAWCTAMSLGEMVNTTAHEDEPAISSDGLSLYFSSNRPGGQGGTDVWVTTRPKKQDAWSDPVNLGPTVNCSNDDFAPSITSDGLTLIFSSTRPGMYSNYADLWMTKRRTNAEPWGEPINLGPYINTDDVDYADISPDGRTLFLTCFKRAEGYGYYDLWQTQIIPIVDLNTDGIVDADDMSIMVDYWGTDHSLCDIAPIPWGDGIVDVEDLKVLAGYLFEEVNDPTLLAHWKLDEEEGKTAYDSVGTNDGTIIGSPQWRLEDGAVDGALELNGTTFIAFDPVLNPADGPFSVLVWIKGGGPGQVIASSGRTNWLMADAATGALMTELSNVGQNVGTLGPEAVITDGNWHRIAFAWDGANTRLYVDTLLVAECAQDGLVNSFTRLLLGTSIDREPGTYWSGLIDDVRIYNRSVSP